MTGRKSSVSSIADGCHKYGWIITIVANMVALGFFAGSVNSSVMDLRRDVEFLKSQVYDLGHSVRSPMTEEDQRDYQSRKDKELRK